MQTLLSALQDEYADLSFVAANAFYWSPETCEVFYDVAKLDDPASPWSLLHETSHALLGHTSYKADLELLHLEVAAWDHAITMAPRYGIEIDAEYVQDCLDTYRDWLYRRSLCPGCGMQCLQTDESSHYRCFNCHMDWHVSPSRFCRPYRRSHSPKTAPSMAFALKMLGR